MESMEIKNYTTTKLINLVRAIKNNKIYVSSDRCAEDNNKKWVDDYLLEIEQHSTDRIEEADFRLFVESALYSLVGDKCTALKLAFQAGIVGSLYAFFNLIINDRFDLLSSFISNQGTGRNKILLQQFTKAMQSLDQKKIDTILDKIKEIEFEHQKTREHISAEANRIINNASGRYITLPEAARVIYDELEDRQRLYSGIPKLQTDTIRKKLQTDTIRKKLACQLKTEPYLESGNKHYFPVSIVAQKAHNVCSEFAVDTYISMFEKASKRESELRNPQHVIPG